jgi:hypothetical protein
MQRRAESDGSNVVRQKYLDGYDGELPEFVVVDDTAYELRWFPRTNPKVGTGAKRGRPKGERERRFKQRKRWDRALAAHSIQWRVPPLSRTQFQKANRGEAWTGPEPEQIKSFDADLTQSSP